MDSNNLFCLFCGCPVPNHFDTFKIHTVRFEKVNSLINYDFHTRDQLEVHELDCPGCRNISVEIVGIGEQYKNRAMYFNPISLAKQYPEYIPKIIREDYEEAHAILNLSPKASATLSRRCLQAMIRDFWGVSKSSLVAEIDAISDKVDSSTKDVLHALRKLGNIGAHPEKDINVIIDIESDEAHKLLKFIELLINKWYIERYNNEELLKSIQETVTKKQNQRNPKNS